MYIFVNHYDIGYMIVIPVGVAVEPESRPEYWARRHRVPEDWVHVYHVVMVGMVEVGRGMHGAMRRRHMAGTAGACVTVARMVLRIYGASSASVVSVGRIAWGAASTTLGIANRTLATDSVVASLWTRGDSTATARGGAACGTTYRGTGAVAVVVAT